MNTSTDNSQQPNVKDTRLPESITIGETVFIIKDTPELVSLIGKVAQVEKSKLYSHIEKLKEELSQLEKVQVEPTDLSGLKTELMSEMKALIQPLVEKQDKIETNTIEEYRSKLIKDNADICIPEMVEGKTKEEIDASLQRSIEVRKRFPTANPVITPLGAAPVVDPEVKRQMDIANASNNFVNSNADQNSSNQPSKPKVQMPNIPVGEPTQTDIARLSPEEFKSRRDELRAQISSLV